MPPNSGIIGVRHYAKLMRWWEGTQGFWHARQTLSTVPPTPSPDLSFSNSTMERAHANSGKAPKIKSALDKSYSQFSLLLPIAQSSKTTGDPGAQRNPPPALRGAPGHSTGQSRASEQPPSRTSRTANQEDGAFGRKGFAGSPSKIIHPLAADASA